MIPKKIKEIEGKPTKEEIEDKDIIDYYKGKKGKDMVDAERLLIKTSRNSFNEGFKIGRKQVLEKVENWIKNNIKREDNPHKKWHQFILFLNNLQEDLK